MSESGDKKNLGNFRTLIEECAADSGYNPKNSSLKLPALNAQYSAADTAVHAVAAARAQNKLAITVRESTFTAMRRLVVRSRNYLKASGAEADIVDDAAEFVRKLRGGTRKPKAAGAVTTGGTTTPAVTTPSHSTSQMSFDNQLGNFQSYLEIVRHITEYDPNEADLKLTSMDSLADDLLTANNTVSITQATLDQARGTRDRLLYLDNNSVVNTALMVKSYVQAALGSDSQLYKKIKPLKFTAAQK